MSYATAETLDRSIIPVIDPRALLGADIDTSYDAVTCGDYLIRRFAKSFAYRRDEP